MYEKVNINRKVDLLDHGMIRLIDYMGTDLSISRNARVSYDAAERAGRDKGSDAALIDYLLTNGHNTPLEAVVITFEVMAPIFVFRQWHRHRTQSYNELSARYKELPEKFYVPELEQITTQSADNKQMKTKEQNPKASSIQHKITMQNMEAFQTYHVLLDEDCPREIARSVLPVGTYSHMFATANLNNWLRFLRERLHPHAQYEIRVYAEAILDFIKDIVPATYESFLKTQEGK